ncbi:sensor histidine kinase [Alteribacter aurantiacus]|uniref:sensor histidine kinase n=1 Tax=Alteribacter aurantiacus TaxID=254410 RepID=UPI0003F75FB1|nr:histidine kinase [Alteribacter aurantiacus]
MRINSYLHSIKAKVIILIIFFLFIPCLFVGFIWYTQSTTVIEENEIQKNETLIKGLNNHLDYYFAGLERTTLPLLTHPLIQQYIRTGVYEHYERLILNSRIREEIFANLVYGRNDIFIVSIATDYGITSTNNRFFVRNQYNDDNDINPIYEKNYHVHGMSIIDSTPVLTITRNLLDITTYEKKGLLSVDLNLNGIANIIEDVAMGDTGFVWLTDAEGNIIYHPHGFDESTEVFSNINGSEEQLGSFITGSGSERKLVTYHRSDHTDFVLIAEVPLAELMGDMIALRNSTVIFVAVLIVLALFVVGGFSFSITHSLMQLKDLMERAKKGDLSVRASEGKKDEIGQLNKGFNTMVKEIGRLIERVRLSQLKEKELEIKNKESELRAMQSQINPHFLYNTLELINSHAIVEDVMPISRMTTSLGDMLRYSISNSNQAVYLADEINHVKTYLDIQQERYRDLEVAIDIRQYHMHAVRAVRLMLQPIVENAFIHGYSKHKMKPSSISILGFEDNGCFVLSVQDKGGGMDLQTKTIYNNAFRMKSEETEMNESLPGSNNCIGLWNVHQRVRLTFGESYGLFISKADSHGTIIEIHLPLKEDFLKRGE